MTIVKGSFLKYSLTRICFYFPFRALSLILSHIRTKYIGLIIGSCGKNCLFNKGLIVKPWLLNVGNNCSFNYGYILHCHGGIQIGSDTRIGPNVTILTNNHGYNKKKLIRLQKPIYKKITIGKDCWIGSGAIILKGVTVGDGAIIGAGAVVTSDVPSFKVVGGNPAREIKDRI